MKVLKPTKQQFLKKRIFGFDIETANNNKDFVMSSLVSEGYEKIFYSPREMIQEIISNPIFKDSLIFATNLSFDFFGTFFTNDETKNFYTLFRGSDLIFAKTWFYDGSFYPKGKIKTKTLPSLLFLDSLNYAKISVADMGKILEKPKLEHPNFLGKHPKNAKEWEIMKKYNLRDSYITFEFMHFIINSFEHLGASVKKTIASSSMSLFRNKYLKDEFYLQPEDILEEQFLSYYGGRTEAFKRGSFKNYNYYDFNSLYPSVMRDYVYPNPNTIRITTKNTYEYIQQYEGISHIEIEVPEHLKYPVLPHRTESGKVIFPTGNIKGWYTHVEIREAVLNGCSIKKVHKTQYFLENIRPFKDFVNDLYSLRQEYKAKNNKMEFVVKIILNSLYGKFGQKYLNKDNWVHESQFDIKTLKKHDEIERKGKFIRVVKAHSDPTSFCIPIWASYVASYGRIKLHRAITRTDPIYCDTDSLITKHKLPESKELGKLKLEMRIKRGVIVRPKFYAIENADTNNLKEKEKHHVKIKGLGKRLSYYEFIGLVNCPLSDEGKTPKIYYNKFSKFKEAIRRDFIPNEIIETHKEFSLEDEKRKWNGEFNPKVLRSSDPLTLSERG